MRLAIAKNRAVALGAASAALLCAADVSALTFTAPRELPGHSAAATISGPPALAINRRGDAVVKWTGVLAADEVAVGNASRLRVVNLPGLQGDVHAIAIAPSGRAIVGYAWTKDLRSDAVPAYTLVATSGRPARVHALRGAGAMRFAAQPDGSFIAIYSTARGVVSRRITAAGNAGKVTRLGTGTLGAFASSPSGHAIACCRRGGATWRYAPGKAWSAVPASGPVRSVATSAGRFHTATDGTALVDGSGRPFTVEPPAAASAFGLGALVVSSKDRRWGVEIVQDGVFTPIATLPVTTTHAGIATAADAAVLAYYDADKRAAWIFAKP